MASRITQINDYPGYENAHLCFPVSDLQRLDSVLYANLDSVRDLYEVVHEALMEARKAQTENSKTTAEEED